MILENALYGPSSFRLWRTPPQVRLLLPPLSSFSHDVRNGTVSKHPVISEIIGTPVHVLVQDRKCRRRRKQVITHLIESKLPPESLIDTELDIQTCSPLLTLLTLARDLDTIELAMAMYELCGNFAVFKPSPLIEELLATPEAQALSARPGAWKRVRSLAKTTAGSKSSLWMRPPLIELDDLHEFARACPPLRGKANFRKAAQLVTGVTSSPFEVQLSMLLALPEGMGGQDMPFFTNNTDIPLTNRARGIYHHSKICADLLFEDDGGSRRIDVECQGAVVHDGEKQIIRDSDRTTALSSMDIDVLLVTYEKIADARTFRNIAETIAAKVGYTLPEQTEEFKTLENELRSHLMIDWSTLGEPSR